jgi:predicted RNA-binding protein YlxR (DUF448 family)
VPRRRCVGCGRIAPKRELLRIAAAPGARRAVLDPACVLPGRGAYLCRVAAASAPGERRQPACGGDGAVPGDAGQLAPDPSCMQLAQRRGAIARALRRAVEFDPDRPGAAANS